MRELLAVFDRTQQKAGREVVLIQGESGIGKTRLLEEFGKSIHGTPSHACTCSPHREPFGGITQLLRSMIGVDASVTVQPSEVVAVATKAVENIVATQPLVLIVDDAHWADEGTRDLVSILSSRRPAHGLLLLLSERQDSGLPTIASAVRSTTGSTIQRIALQHLTQQQTSELMKRRAPARSSKLIVDRVFRLSEGNPLHIEELQDAAESPGGIPLSAQEAIRQRVARLSNESRHLLELLATAGQPVARSRVEYLCAAVRGPGEQALLELVQNGFLVTASSFIQFAHPLHMETIALDIPASERVGYHRALAEALLNSRDPADTQPSIAVQLAEHWHEGGTPEQAIIAAIDAGAAIERSMPEDALLFYTRALKRAGSLPAWPHAAIGPVEVRRRAALAALYAGEPEQALRFLNDAIDMLAPDWAADRALLLEHRGRILHALSDPATNATMLEALAYLPASASAQYVVRIKAGAGLALATTGQPEKGQALLAEALLVAQESNDGNLRAIAECDQATAALIMGHVALASEHAERCRLLGMSADSAHEVISGYIVGARAEYLLTGDLTRSIAIRNTGLDYCLSHRQARTAGVALHLSLIEDHIESGDWDKAQTLLEDLPRTVGGRLNTSDGELARLFLAARRGLTVAPPMPLEDLAHSSDPQYESYFLSLAIPIAHAELDLPTVRRLESRGLALSDGSDPTAAGRALYLVDALTAALQAEADLEQDTGERARRTKQLLADAEAMYRLGRTTVLAPTEFTDGVIDVARAERQRALGKGSGARAIEKWSLAINCFRKTGVRPRLAYALFRYAEAISGTRRGKQKCLQAIEEAHELASQMQAAPLLRSIEAFARRFEYADSTPLSTREMEVARLIWQGFTRANVAKTLDVSHRTVDAHMKSIFGKLNIRKATELVSWYQTTHGDA